MKVDEVMRRSVGGCVGRSVVRVYVRGRGIDGICLTTY